MQFLNSHRYLLDPWTTLGALIESTTVCGSPFGNVWDLMNARETFMQRLRIIRHAVYFAVILISYIICAEPAHSSPFLPCDKIKKNPRSSPTELAICGNNALFDLDVAMNSEFSQTKLKGAARSKFVKEQRQWLQLRDKCKADVTCLKNTMETRLREMRKQILPSKVGSLILRWVTKGPQFIPQVETGVPAAVKDKVNKALVDEVSKVLDSYGSSELDPFAKFESITVNNGILIVSYDGETCGAYCTYYHRKLRLSFATGEVFPAITHIGPEGDRNLVKVDQSEPESPSHAKVPSMFKPALTSAVLLALAKKYDPKNVGITDDKSYEDYDEACDAPEVISSGFEILLSESGFGFAIESQPPHVVQSCGWLALLPHEALEPYLTENTKVMMQSLRKRCSNDLTCKKRTRPDTVD